VNYVPEGLEALIFTAEGDMRQAVNNLQSTVYGFGLVSADHVFKVCDQPHPIVCQQMVAACIRADVDKALELLGGLWGQGYSAMDLVGTLFRVVKGFDMAEYLKLEFLKNIGMTHMKLVNGGIQSLVQLSSLIGMLCKLNMNPKEFEL
ncbi:replication factor C subunit 4, partial [Quaeritorhiza haematococci]